MEQQQQQQPQQFVIAQLQAPAGLVAPGPVVYGPNDPIADATVKAEHEYFRAIKKYKAANGGVVITDADYVAALKRKTAIDLVATEQVYPRVGVPSWAVELMAKLDAQSTLLKVVQYKLDLPALRARNAEAFSTANDEAGLSPLPCTVAGNNLGLLPEAANPPVFFPPTVGAFKNLTTARVKALAKFYDINLVGNSTAKLTQLELYIKQG